MKTPDSRYAAPEGRGQSANWKKFETLARQYRDDEAVRARIDSGDVTDALQYLGIGVDAGVEVRIVADTSRTTYFAMPAPDSSMTLSDDSLTEMAGGGHCAGSAACAGTAGTMACSTVPSSASSAGSASTVGSASSGD